MSSSTHKINHACILVEKNALQQFLDIFSAKKSQWFAFNAFQIL